VLELPTSLQAIEREAFAYCAALTSIDLSMCTSLDGIEARAFDGCTALATAACARMGEGGSSSDPPRRPRQRRRRCQPDPV